MANYQEGDFTVASQHGAKSVSLPLQNVGNSYATEVRRAYRQLAANWDPIRNDSYSYTNLLLRSDDFSSASWTKAAATGTASAATDLEGGTTATKLAEDATNAAHNASQALAVASGALSFGGFFKADVRNYVRLRINNGTDGNLAVAVFNLSAGTVLSGTGSIKKLFNGWYWCAVTGTATVSNSTCFVDLTSDGSTFTYSGTAGAGVYAWRLTAIASAPAVPWPAIATTAATRTVSVPAVDPDDAMAFLVEETEPEASTLEVGVAQWARRYANVPAETAFPTSLLVSKPTIAGTIPVTIGDYVVNQPDTSVESYDAYENKTVTSDSGVPTFYPTGGTYPLSFLATTTGSLNYNDSAATVEAALDALTPVVNRGGCSVTGNHASVGGLVVTFASYAAATLDVSAFSPTASATVVTTNGGYTQAVEIAVNSPGWSSGNFTISIASGTTSGISGNVSSAATIQSALNAISGVADRGNCTVSDLFNNGLYIRFTINFSNPTISGDASSLTPAPSVITVTPDAVGRVQTITFRGGQSTRTVYAATHGIVSGDTIYIRATTPYFGITDFTVMDGNTIQLTVPASVAWASASSVTKIGRRTKSGYKPGVANIRAMNTTAYYLPGYTPGIATSADIPLATPQGDGDAFLQAVFAGTGNVNYRVGELSYYAAPILQQNTVTIKASDV